MSESAPLLNDPSVIGDELSPATAARPSRLSKLIKILRVSTLVLSTLIVILVIANLIVLSIAPFSYSYWQRHIDNEVIGWYIASAITSVIILLAPIPVLISFANDLTLSVGTIVCMVQWIGNMPFSECNGHYDYNSRKWFPPHPKCKDYKLALNIIMGFTAAFGILLAASYILLLLIRAYKVVKGKSWKGIPTGEITWTVSLNVLADGNERTYGFSVGAKSDSRAAHGPVHL